MRNTSAPIIVSQTPMRSAHRTVTLDSGIHVTCSRLEVKLLGYGFTVGNGKFELCYICCLSIWW